MTSPIVNLTTAELAERLRVDPSTVRRWVESGKLQPTFTTPGGHHRFREDAALEQLSRRAS